MKTAKIISALGVVVMGAAILYALIAGDFSTEGNIIMSMPWGIVSLVDLYTGFTLFAMWIVYRERSLVIAAMWIVLLFTLGFFTGALYTFIALQTSGENWQRFWMGKHG
jgi:hypothetical protein